MKQKVINKAIKVINRHIRFYQKKLLCQLELKAEAELKNGNLKVVEFDDYQNNIKNYEMILSNLLLIRSAIRNGKTEIRIYGEIQSITSKILKKSGFETESDGFERMYIYPIEDD